MTQKTRVALLHLAIGMMRGTIISTAITALVAFVYVTYKAFTVFIPLGVAILLGGMLVTSFYLIAVLNRPGVKKSSEDAQCVKCGYVDPKKQEIWKGWFR